MESTLAALRPGQTGIVLSPEQTGIVRQPGQTGIALPHERSSDSGSSLAVRLRDLGFTAGTPVTCILTAPLGDPVSYRIRGTTIALRRRDASSVQVELLPQTAAENAVPAQRSARPAPEAER